MKAAALLRAGLSAGLMAFALPVAAQQVTLEPSAAVRCLTPSRAERGQPEYPFEAWKFGRGGHLKIELVFQAPDRAPEFKVLSDAADPSFAAELRSYVQRFRVPCMKPDEAPVTLTQEYVFQPEERFVAQGLPADPRDLERLNMIGCVTHVSGQRRPVYPTSAMDADLQGRVLAWLRFTAPDAPPEASIHARRYARVLADAVETWVRGYRMPCHRGGLVEYAIHFEFRMQGGGAYGFKPLRLQQFMGSVRNIGLQRLAFDTTRMGCPFDLWLTYRQPELPNVVVEKGPGDPTRAELISWLRESVLDLPKRSLDAVFLDETVITVPCLKIDLKPKE